MTASNNARAFIKREETGGKAPALTAYKDGIINGVQVYSIGYGTQFYEDGTRVKSGDVISTEKAESMFNAAINSAANAVARGLTVSVNQNQFDALTSFSYNIGETRFLTSQILKNVNAKVSNDTLGAVWKSSYVTSAGTFLQGLADRRVREFALYTTSGVLAGGTNWLLIFGFGLLLAKQLKG